MLHSQFTNRKGEAMNATIVKKPHYTRVRRAKAWALERKRQQFKQAWQQINNKPQPATFNGIRGFDKVA